MNRDEIVTALRCCSAPGDCNKCPGDRIERCVTRLMSAAVDLIENQQRHIEALMKANDSLKDAIARRDKQIEMLKKQGEVMAREQDAMGKRIAMQEKGKWTKTY